MCGLQERGDENGEMELRWIRERENVWSAVLWGKENGRWERKWDFVEEESRILKEMRPRKNAYERKKMKGKGLKKKNRLKKKIDRDRPWRR